MLAYSTEAVVAALPKVSSASSFKLFFKLWLQAIAPVTPAEPPVSSSGFTHGLGGSEKAGLNVGLLQKEFTNELGSLKENSHMLFRAQQWWALQSSNPLLVTSLRVA